MNNANVKNLVATRVVVDCVLSFPHLYEPYAIVQGQPEKYSACLIISKSDKAYCKMKGFNAL